MKRSIPILALLLVAGCSASDSGASPAATASADAAAAAAAKAEKTPGASDKPLTAESCIEDNKGMGTGTRGELTKACLVDACDQGDKKSCTMVKSFAGEMGAEVEEDPAAEVEPETAQ